MPIKKKNTIVEKQKRTVKALNRKLYSLRVACTNHSLNLAGVHAASEPVYSVTFFFLELWRSLCFLHQLFDGTLWLPA